MRSRLAGTLRARFPETSFDSDVHGSVVGQEVAVDSAAVLRPFLRRGRARTLNDDVINPRTELRIAGSFDQLAQPRGRARDEIEVPGEDRDVAWLDELVDECQRFLKLDFRDRFRIGRRVQVGTTALRPPGRMARRARQRRRSFAHLSRSTRPRPRSAPRACRSGRGLITAVERVTTRTDGSSRMTLA